MKSKFTDADVRNMKTSQRLQDNLEGEGFGVRVYGKTGTKIFYFVYTFDNKRRFLNLGTYDPKFETVGLDGKKVGSLAYHRQKYIEAKNKLHKGIDPLLERETSKAERKQAPLISDFVDEFIRDYAKEHNRGWKEVERALKAEIVPRWGKRKITDITRRDLVIVMNEIKERGAPVMANRVLAYTRKMFSWAVSESAVLKVNPFLRMKRPSKENPRERSLSKDEIRLFWANLDNCKMSNQIKRALKLILVTAQRPGEIIGMHRREIDGDWWEIPSSRSKNKLTHRVFLSETAKKLIGGASGYIFESPVYPAKPPDNPGKPYGERNMTHDIKKNLPHTLESQVEDRLKIPFFVPHDLRRTATGLMAEAKVELEIRERVLNHKKGKLDGTYNKYEYADEKQVAFKILESKLLSIINDTEFVDPRENVNKLVEELMSSKQEIEMLKLELSRVTAKKS